MCPDLAAHYATEVMDEETDTTAWAESLNDRYAAGYRLVHIVAQGDRTIQVFEHYLHPDRWSPDGD
ncbi:MAG: hypothetical protein WKF47_16555 [Geodermatophilaceae bacterium]